MLAMKKSVGAKRGNRLHEGNEVCWRGVQPGFKRQGTHYQNSKQAYHTSGPPKDFLRMELIWSHFSRAKKNFSHWKEAQHFYWRIQPCKKVWFVIMHKLVDMETKHCRLIPTISWYDRVSNDNHEHVTCGRVDWTTVAAQLGGHGRVFTNNGATDPGR